MNKEKYTVQITKAAWLEAAYLIIRGSFMILVVAFVLYAVFYLGITPRII